MTGKQPGVVAWTADQSFFQEKQMFLQDSVFQKSLSFQHATELNEQLTFSSKQRLVP